MGKTLVRSFVLVLLVGGMVFSALQAWSFVCSEDDSLCRGKKAYDRYCAHCHGVSGRGDGEGALIRGVPMGDLTNKAYMSLLSDQELYERIAYGEEKFPYLQMPGWKNILSSRTIWDIIRYIRTLEVDRGPLKGPTPQERAERFRKDPLERGRIYYLRYCSQCHGKNGDGRGWAAKNLLSKPIDFRKTPVTRQQILDYIRGKRRGGNMVVFSKIISDQVVDEIIKYIETVFQKRAPARE